LQNPAKTAMKSDHNGFAADFNAPELRFCLMMPTIIAYKKIQATMRLLEHIQMER